MQDHGMTAGLWATTTTFKEVAEFVLSTRPADIPEPVLQRAALLFLDTIGVAAASSRMRAGRIARDAACRYMAAGRDCEGARLLFDGRKVSLPGAVYAAATQIDNLDAHDGYNPVKGHIGVVAAPALVALAEGRPDLSGRDALAALVIGYEIAGRAGASLHATVNEYHTSGAWNALGVAAMAVRLRGGDAETLREALGIAEFHGPRSQMMREIATPTMLHDGSGWGAHAGMMAALLAEDGFNGAPAITVEGHTHRRHWTDLGRSWLTMDQYIKPYPVCRWAHGAVEGARTLRAEHGIVADDIERVRISTFEKATKLFPGMPSTTSEAQYSLPFAVAQMLRTGRLGLAEIEGPALNDPIIADLVARVSLEVAPTFEAKFPGERWSEIEIELRSGKRLSSGTVAGRGGRTHPFGEGEIRTKFREYSEPALGEARAGAIESRCLSLVEKKQNFRDLGAHLCEPSPPFGEEEYP